MVHVTLLHGFPLDHHMWDDTVEALREEGHEVLAPDLPGFGTAPPEEPVTMASMAAYIVSLWDAAGVEESVVVGFSMGGYVALQLAVKHPGRLAGLVLADTRAEEDTPEGRAKRLATVDGLLSRGAAAIADGMLQGLLRASTRKDRPALVAEVRAMMDRQSNAGLAAAQQAMAKRPDMRLALEHIHIRTMVVVGEDDPVTPLDAARPMAEAIPGAVLLVIPDAAHLVPMEQPKRFAGVLRHWLAD